MNIKSIYQFGSEERSIGGRAEGMVILIDFVIDEL
jgi:hypothetical protein